MAKQGAPFNAKKGTSKKGKTMDGKGRVSRGRGGLGCGQLGRIWTFKMLKMTSHFPKSDTGC